MDEDLGAGRGQDSGDFVARLLANQRGIYGLLVALLPHEKDLDDVFQQVCLALWQERAKFDPARPFLPWAYAFTRNVVHMHLRTTAKNRLQLSPGIIDRIVDGREEADLLAESRRAALDACLERLSSTQRDLLAKRYESPESLKEIAASMNVSAASLTMKLQRIRHALLECVERRIASREA